jgi:hypothetical protein
MKYIKLFEGFNSPMRNQENPYKDATRMGESVFFFQEEDHVWYGIFPNDVAAELRDVSEAYMDVAISNGSYDELYTLFTDRREGLAYIEYESENEWRACTPQEIDVNDYEYISMPDGTDVMINNMPKYGGLPLFALERGMITHYQGGNSVESMTVDEYFDYLDDESDRWASM